MHKTLLAVLVMGVLAGCAADPVWAPEEDVQRVKYREPGPARLTLFTMISNETGAGGHSSLMVNGSQRVIFDPSGSFVHPVVPERNDVLFGITPKIADIYTRYHARETWHVVVQELDVSPEVAELALKLAKENGAVPNAYCAHSTSGILRRLPGMEGLRQGMYPVKLADQFRQVPGVRESVLHEYDSDDNSRLLEAWDPERFAKTKKQ
ncbi:hypothetical protein RXV86_13670 [Alisedimentitalea sp. MJ-SS2]|uniref:hypothetical protein n=1 Tax=Aliisedimentitalea sp. MJ-SS2 TaxID=3049795 RepID=UPI00291465D1|nr:hypothetical protein [Alisedimentitalea sp. MJ-SS2]MDU8928434.1 hypothetical protein [Alisedimentitalea sp. MJ-SS2]